MTQGHYHLFPCANTHLLPNFESYCTCRAWNVSITRVFILGALVNNSIAVVVAVVVGPKNIQRLCR